MGILLVVVIGVAINIAVAYLLYNGLSRIPLEDRTMEPYFAWFILIPLAGIVFLWILLPFKIPESLQKYFQKHPDDSAVIPKDYGKNFGLICVISLTACSIPYINLVAWIPYLIFLVLYLMNYWKMVQMLPVLSPGTGPTMSFTEASSIPRDQAYEHIAAIKKLLDEGALTQEEFDREKQRILSQGKTD